MPVAANYNCKIYIISSLQEYFFKSQESLATVIDFVDEELETSKDSSLGESAELSSTHSSPREPASRRRKDLQLSKPLTP